MRKGSKEMGNRERLKERKRNKERTEEEEETNWGKR